MVDGGEGCGGEGCGGEGCGGRIVVERIVVGDCGGYLFLYIFLF